MTRILWSDAGSAMSVQRNVTVLIFRQPLDMQRMKQMRTFTQPIFTQYGAARAAFTVVEQEAVSDVSKELREASAQLIREFPAQASATVIEGAGFKSVAGRLIVSGMALLSGGKTQIKIFATVDDAADWLAARIPKAPGEDNISAAGLIAQVTRTRSAIR